MKQAAQSDPLTLLDSDMAKKNLQGYWSLGMEGLPCSPMTSVEPCLWKWADVHESLLRAGEAITLEQSERCVARSISHFQAVAKTRSFALRLRMTFRHGLDMRGKRKDQRSTD